MLTYARVYFWALYSIPLVYMSVLMLIANYLDYYRCGVSRSRSVSPPTLLYSSGVFWIVGVPWYFMWIVEWVFYFYKTNNKTKRNFDRECIESIKIFAHYCHLNIESFDHKLPFNLLMFSFISSSNVS